MADIILVKPNCRERFKTKRLDEILERSLDGHSYANGCHRGGI